MTAISFPIRRLKIKKQHETSYFLRFTTNKKKNMKGFQRNFVFIYFYFIYNSYDKEKGSHLVEHSFGAEKIPIRILV